MNVPEIHAFIIGCFGVLTQATQVNLIAVVFPHVSATVGTASPNTCETAHRSKAVKQTTFRVQYT